MNFLLSGLNAAQQFSNKYEVYFVSENRLVSCVCVCRDDFRQHLLRRVGNSFAFNLVLVFYLTSLNRVLFTSGVKVKNHFLEIRAEFFPSQREHSIGSKTVVVIRPLTDLYLNFHKRLSF